MLDDATRCGAIRNIYLAMQPTGPSLADCVRVLELLEKPDAAKIDGKSANRRALTPEPEHGLVSIMGPNGNTMRTRSERSGLSLHAEIGTVVQALPIDGL